MYVKVTDRIFIANVYCIYVPSNTVADKGIASISLVSKVLCVSIRRNYEVD